MKDILTILVAGLQDPAGLASSASLANRFQAKVTAAIINEVPDPNASSADLAAGIPPRSAALMDEMTRRGTEFKEATERWLSKSVPESSVVLFNEFRYPASNYISELARLNDLCVATQPAEPVNRELMSVVLDKVLLDGICGILCLPDGRAYTPNPKHAVIAWNGSREAARSLQAGLPLLKEARDVTVLMVDPSDDAPGGTLGSVDKMLERLERHHIHSNLVSIESGELTTAEAIAAEVEHLGADLLVFGAQAEGGLRQWFTGSVSRELLGKAMLPSLIAH